LTVVILPEAENDLEEIGDLIASDAPRRAITFIRELRLGAESIESAPLAYPLVPGYERESIRRRVHGNYIIFYTVEGGSVFILRFLHGARDYNRILDLRR
jgi:plasmid stabilization system protein ParE